MEEDWKAAFRQQNGYRLLTLLRENRNLLLVEYGGCNILHLAVRKRWFGLVWEVLQNFCQLSTYETPIQGSYLSCSDLSTGETPIQGSSSSRSEPIEYLSQEQFWRLLNGIESGDKDWKYRSGLDVLGMAVILGHGAISTILAEAVRNVGGASRYYDGEVILSLGSCEVEKKFIASPDSREQLRKIMRECFSVEATESRIASSSDQQTTNERAPAPNLSASDQEAAGNPQATPLEDTIDPAWKKEWEVTTPFLPVEEFLFLACCLHTATWEGSFPNYDNVRSARERALERAFERSRNFDFHYYLSSITDTWGEAVHHALHAEKSEEQHDPSRTKLVSEFDPNRLDSWGRTPLYTALALGLRDASEQLLKVGGTARREIKAWGRWEFGGVACEIDVKKVSAKNGYSPHEKLSIGQTVGFHSILRSPHLMGLELGDGWIMPLQHCVYEGDVTLLQTLIQIKYYDVACNDNIFGSHGKEVAEMLNCSALHVAAAVGRPDAIQTMLASGRFDPLVQDRDGNTPLQFATLVDHPLDFPHFLGDFCAIPDDRIGNLYTEEFSEFTSRREKRMLAESARRGCINLLLQAGIDVWQTNKNNQIADPGSKCSPEYSFWWYDKVSKETQEAKVSLTTGANAISVTAALVATASYVGPLQPPRGYTEETMQVDDLTVRIFIVCNTLAFYLALSAIILSLTPSLHMPQESTLDELIRIRRTVTVSVGVLIMSIVGILFAFASASIAVIPNGDSWNHGGLTVSTLIIGGLICLFFLLFCVSRLLRLIKHKDQNVRRLYKKYMWM